MMYKYTIYCSEEQTKKSIELGAPLKRIYNSANVKHIETFLFVEKISDYYIYVEIPTAEQMIGWLEEQENISIEVSRQYGINKYCYYIFDSNGNDIESIDNKVRFSSKKEATLAAINSALKYLLTKK